MLIKMNVNMTKKQFMVNIITVVKLLFFKLEHMMVKLKREHLKKVK